MSRSKFTYNTNNKSHQITCKIVVVEDLHRSHAGFSRKVGKNSLWARRVPCEDGHYNVDTAVGAFVGMMGPGTHVVLVVPAPLTEQSVNVWERVPTPWTVSSAVKGKSTGSS